MKIVILIGCALLIVLTLFRIFWIFFPNLLHNKRIFRLKEPNNFEKICYYLVAILLLVYSIYNTIEKINHLGNISWPEN